MARKILGGLAGAITLVVVPLVGTASSANGNAAGNSTKAAAAWAVEGFYPTAQECAIKGGTLVATGQATAYTCLPETALGGHKEGTDKAKDVGPGKAKGIRPAKATSIGPGKAKGIRPAKATNIGPGKAKSPGQGGHKEGTDKAKDAGQAVLYVEHL